LYSVPAGRRAGGAAGGERADLAGQPGHQVGGDVERLHREREVRLGRDLVDDQAVADLADRLDRDVDVTEAGGLDAVDDVVAADGEDGTAWTLMPLAPC
jgi:hypothetical protein